MLDVEWPTKRLAEGTPKWVECYRSTNSSSDERVALAAETAATELIEHTGAEVEEAIGTFGVTCLVVDESSGADTPSRVYDGDADVTVDTPLTPRSPLGMLPSLRRL